MTSSFLMVFIFRHRFAVLVKIASTPSREVLTFSRGTSSSRNSLIILCTCSVCNVALNFFLDLFSQINCFGRCNNVSLITGATRFWLTECVDIKPCYNVHTIEPRDALKLFCIRISVKRVLGVENQVNIFWNELAKRLQELRTTNKIMIGNTLMLDTTNAILAILNERTTTDTSRSLS